MKTSDVKVCSVICFVACIFSFIPAAGEAFRVASLEHGYLLSFFKFAILATFGECVALRISTGHYTKPGFGILPRMVIWGTLGVMIKTAFTIFVTGAPALLVSLGVAESTEALFSGPMHIKVLTAFCISTAMNLIFAPVMMTVHKITDTHIQNNGGRLSALASPIDFSGILNSIDWKVMWNFVFKKTIPFFWIPAHTLTFLLPPEFRILFAAMLGMALGLILAFAGSMKQQPSLQAA